MSTRLSNSLTVGTILGQISIGILCDVAGRKAGIIVSTVCIVVGIILATAAKADTLIAFSWFMTIARGLTGIGVGGEYPSSSVSAVEAANEKFLKQRGPTFILVTNLVLSFGGPLASILYLYVRFLLLRHLGTDGTRAQHRLRGCWGTQGQPRTFPVSPTQIRLTTSVCRKWSGASSSVSASFHLSPSSSSASA